MLGRWVVRDKHQTWARSAGKVFCMVPSLQRIHRDPKDCRRILPAGLESSFAPYRIVSAGTHGDTLSPIAALSGIAAEELNFSDPLYFHPQ